MAILPTLLAGGFFAQETGTADARVDPNVCGRNALAVVARFAGVNYQVDTLERLLPGERAPFSFADLEKAGGVLGLETYLVRWQEGRRSSFECASILHIRRRPESSAPDHFVVCLGRTGDKLCVVDFPGRPALVPLEDFLDIWTGDALYVESPGGLAIANLRRANFRNQLYQGVAYAAGLGALTLVCLGGVRVTRRLTRDGRMALMPIAASVGVLVLFCITAGYVWFSTHRGRAGLVTDTPIVRVDASESAAEHQGLILEIRNATRRAITIRRITSSCLCIVASGLRGTRLSPGGTCNIEADVSVPEMGAASQYLLVHHDGAESPLRISIESTGRNKPPIVRSVANGSPTLISTNGRVKEQIVRIKTTEEMGSSPWVKELACDGTDVIIQLVSMSEDAKQQSGLVEREYRFSLGWSGRTSFPRFPPRWSLKLDSTLLSHGALGMSKQQSLRPCFLRSLCFNRAYERRS